MSAHKLLAEAITARVPAGWRVIDHERELDELDAITVQIKLDTVTRLPASGPGVYLVGWTVTVVTPWSDPGRADPAVYDALLELVAGLDDLEWIRWTQAQKVLDAGRYAFDITLESLTKPADPAAYAAGAEMEP